MEGDAQIVGQVVPIDPREPLGQSGMPPETVEALSAAVNTYEQNLRTVADYQRLQDGSATLTDAHINTAVKKLGHKRKVGLKRVICSEALILIGGALIGISLCAVFNPEGHAEGHPTTPQPVAPLPTATGQPAPLVTPPASGPDGLYYAMVAGGFLLGGVLWACGYYVREHD